MNYHKILRDLIHESRRDDDGFSEDHINHFFLAYFDLGLKGFRKDEIEKWFETTFPLIDPGDRFIKKVHSCYEYYYSQVDAKIMLYQKFSTLENMPKFSVLTGNEHLVPEIDLLKQKVDELEKSVETLKKQKIEK